MTTSDPKSVTGRSATTSGPGVRPDGEGPDSRLFTPFAQKIPDVPQVNEQVPHGRRPHRREQELPVRVEPDLGKGELHFGANRENGPEVQEFHFLSRCQASRTEPSHQRAPTRHTAHSVRGSGGPPRARGAGALWTSPPGAHPTSSRWVGGRRIPRREAGRREGRTAIRETPAPRGRWSCPTPPDAQSICSLELPLTHEGTAAASQFPSRLNPMSSSFGRGTSTGPAPRRPGNHERGSPGGTPRRSPPARDAHGDLLQPPGDPLPEQRVRAPPTGPAQEHVAHRAPSCCAHSPSPASPTTAMTAQRSPAGSTSPSSTQRITPSWFDFPASLRHHLRVGSVYSDGSVPTPGR